MKIIATPILGVNIIEPDIFGDERGFLFESFNAQKFKEKICDMTFVQDNHSRSEKNVLRGLHYQIKRPQGKLVRVISGTIFDVAVDIRKNSPTFGQWTGIDLSAENKRQFWIPPGLAHGFMVLTDTAEVLYKITDYWMPEYERCIQWNDPDLAIPWPIDQKPILSLKDQAGVFLKTAQIES